MDVKSPMAWMRSLAARLWRRLDVVADDPGIEQDWLVKRTDQPDGPAPAAGYFDQPEPEE
jgi:hypothetical protein